MSRNYDYHNSSYSMDEYLERLDRIQRMPSLMGEYPNFPNVHEVLNNKPAKTEEIDDHQKTVDCRQSPEVQKRVHKKTTAVGKHDVEAESIDAETDGFIQQKHKGFALCKWDTYKVY